MAQRLPPTCVVYGIYAPHWSPFVLCAVQEKLAVPESAVGRPWIAALLGYGGGDARAAGREVHWGAAVLGVLEAGPRDRMRLAHRGVGVAVRLGPRCWRGYRCCWQEVGLGRADRGICGNRADRGG